MTTKDFKTVGVAATIQLARLLQLTVEYLLHVQAALMTERNDLHKANALKDDRIASLESDLRTAQAQRDMALDNCRHYRRLAEDSAREQQLSSIL